jgi:hypothetical protein
MNHPPTPSKDREQAFWERDRYIRTLLKLHGTTPTNSLVTAIHAMANRELEEQQDSLKQSLVAEMPEKVKEYPIKIVSKDNPSNVWASSQTHGLEEKDELRNHLIEQFHTIINKVFNGRM